MEIDRLAELRNLASVRVGGATLPANSNMPSHTSVGRRLQSMNWIRRHADINAAATVPFSTSMVSASAGVHVTSAGPDTAMVTLPSSARAGSQWVQTAEVAQVHGPVGAASGNLTDGSVREATPRTRATTATRREG